MTDIAARTEFRVFRSVADSGKFVRGICAPNGQSKFSRRGIDELTKFVQEDFGAKGLAWFRVEEDGTLNSTIAKNFQAEELAEIAARMDAKPGDLVMIIADTWEVSCKALYGLRKRVGAALELYDPKTMNFSWVTEFPMFEHDPEADRWIAMHHPFTAPLVKDLGYLDTDRQNPRSGLRSSHQRLRGWWWNDSNSR